MEDLTGLTLEAKLSLIQSEIKAPKTQYSEFGDYNFRSVEDIQKALKPIASKYGCVCTCSDELVLIGERYYVKATARLYDTTNQEIIDTCAYAREELEKKKLDGSQLTGVASSYARKYALGGLLQLDDTKDSDGLPPEEPKEDKKTTKDTKKEATTTKTLTLEEAKKQEIDIKGKRYTLGEMNSEQLIYLRDKAGLTDKDFLDKVSLVLMDMARTGNLNETDNKE